MSKIFTTVPMQKPRFNTFNLSHSRKFPMPAGKLIPCFLAETVPNDTFTINTSQLIRMAPMVAPPMHEISAYIHFFFVPNRIAWQGWEKFINGGKDGDDTPVFPFVNLGQVGPDIGNISDYFGLPLKMDPADLADAEVSAIPYWAYLKIWYEYYRDQNLTPEIPFLEDGMSDGDQTSVLGDFDEPQSRAWQHDYFTSALPWTQRGPEATIPLGSVAELAGDGGLVNLVSSGPSNVRAAGAGGSFGAGGLDYDASVGSPPLAFSPLTESDGSAGRQIDVTPHTFLDTDTTYVDLSTATAASINDLRRAFRLQEWLELNARAGARYNETIRAHFGIDPGDARLQRPEFLGGSSSPIVISEVLQTSSTDETSPLATMAGHGVSINGKNVVRYKCREHGYIMGIMSIMPRSAYQQGIPKHFQKFDKFDYYWKSFANIGEQPIYNRELWFDTATPAPENDEIFGYTPRYAEYKYINDSVHGTFRTSLDFWHMGRIFPKDGPSSRPTLSREFIEMQPEEISRIFAVPELTQEQFYVHMHHQVMAKRPMPFFGTPTI